MRMQVQSQALLSGLGIWRFCELWCWSQTWLGSGGVVAMAVASSCSSDSTPSLGTSICHRWGPKKQKTNKKPKTKKIYKKIKTQLICVTPLFKFLQQFSTILRKTSAILKMTFKALDELTCSPFSFIYTIHHFVCFSYPGHFPVLQGYWSHLLQSFHLLFSLPGVILSFTWLDFPSHVISSRRPFLIPSL